MQTTADARKKYHAALVNQVSTQFNMDDEERMMLDLIMNAMFAPNREGTPQERYESAVRDVRTKVLPKIDAAAVTAHHKEMMAAEGY